MQTDGTSPAYRYSYSAPDTILGLYLHTSEPFQNNLSDVFGTNRPFCDMPVQQHLLFIARVFYVLSPKETCLSLSAGMPLTSSAPCPLSEQEWGTGVCCMRLWGPCWHEYMHLMLKLPLVFRWPWIHHFIAWGLHFPQRNMQITLVSFQKDFEAFS